MDARQWRYRVLGVGAAVGLVLALAGAFVPSSLTVAEPVLARVNGKAITREEVSVALERSASKDLRATLAFLVDQELLIQRGVAIGLLDSDLTVRKALAMAVIDAVVAEVLKEDPSEEEFRAFYAAHRSVFSLPARLHVQHLFVAEDGDPHAARVRAERAVAAIAQGMPFSEARERYGEREHVSLPDTPLPIHVVRRSLGPILAETVLTMRVGEVSPPVRSPQGYHVLHLVGAYPERVQPYEAVTQEVRREYFRRKRDEALQRLVDRLRRSATIVLSPQAPIEKE
ncbi:MAG: peptidyl-prolyl cis-trans isomerase [Candidatus Binatia bacterium]|nr:peptidyl-prolyl cis-trans isomerase [Candidatus Binatia bacterium]